MYKYAASLGLLVLAGCTADVTDNLVDDTDTQEQMGTAEQELQVASIWPSPQTVTVAPGSVGTSKICWYTEDQTYPVWIKVSVSGGAEQLFTKESNAGYHCANAPWIVAGFYYSFLIRTSQSGGAILASTYVEGIAN